MSLRLHVSALWRYPLKSARGEPLERVSVGPLGLAGDRRYALVAPGGRFLSQRKDPQMTLIRARWRGGDVLALSAPGAAPLSVSPPGAGAPRIEVTMWGERFPARAVGPGADAWCSRVLGRPARLAYLAPEDARPVDPRYGEATDRVAFADGYPVLVANAASLRALQAQRAPGEAPLTMERFRPNLVVEGADPFAEDGWAALRIGGVTLDLVKPCSRCVMVNVDPTTGTKDPSVLRGLAHMRRQGRRVLFGVNAVPRGADGTNRAMRVGDTVETVEIIPR